MFFAECLRHSIKNLNPVVNSPRLIFSLISGVGGHGGRGLEARGSGELSVLRSLWMMTSAHEFGLLGFAPVKEIYGYMRMMTELAWNVLGKCHR